ncbi:hypothetical protein [Caballeronia sp. SL2Y3]|uniref:hypothetical protein n=1 Tax=Caballeronia sp. SL2Y3 TaxID=2878151 RepID=UPI00351D6FFF
MFDLTAQRAQSVLDVSCSLTPMLLRLALVLPALHVRLLVRGAAVLFGMPGALARLLAHIAPGAALLRLLRRQSAVRPRQGEHGGCDRNEPE